MGRDHLAGVLALAACLPHGAPANGIGSRGSREIECPNAPAALVDLGQRRDRRSAAKMRFAAFVKLPELLRKP